MLCTICSQLQKLFEIDCWGPAQVHSDDFRVGRHQDSGVDAVGCRQRNVEKEKTSRENRLYRAKKDRLLFKDSSSIYLFSQEILNSNNPIFAALILAQPNILFLSESSHPIHLRLLSRLLTLPAERLQAGTDEMNRAAVLRYGLTLCTRQEMWTLRLCWRLESS